MEKTFRPTLFSKIFNPGLPALIACFSLFLSIRYHTIPVSEILIVTLAPLIIAAIILSNQLKRKVVVSDRCIMKTNILGTKEMMNNNVKGFRIADNSIFILPLQDGDPKIVIRYYTSLRNDEELLAWLNEHHTNLDRKEYQRELEEILHDTNIGTAREEREASVKRSGMLARIYNIGAFILFGLSLFIFGEIDASWIVDTLVFLYPLAGIALIVFSKGIIKLITKASSAHYQVWLGIYLPVIVILIKAAFGYHIFAYDNLWLPFALISTGVFLIFNRFGLKKAGTAVKGQIFLAIFLALFFGYAYTLQINCVYDNSKPKRFRATIIDRRIFKGKNYSYYLTLAPWGTKLAPEEIEVRRALYQQLSADSTVTINVKPGLLHIPWFTLTK